MNLKWFLIKIQKKMKNNNFQIEITKEECKPKCKYPGVIIIQEVLDIVINIINYFIELAILNIQ